MSGDLVDRDASLAAHAAAIRTLGRRVVRDIVEIGARLTECKGIAGHGNWLSWLEREFGWDAKTAERFMRVHELGGKIDNLSNLDIGVSSLYLLAAPSTPEVARAEIIARAQRGETLPHKQVKLIIHQHKPAPKLPAPVAEAVVERGYLPKQVSEDARWVWSGLRHLERIIEKEPRDVMSTMTDKMRDDVHTLARLVAAWLGRIGAAPAAPDMAETQRQDETPSKTWRNLAPVGSLLKSAKK